MSVELPIIIRHHDLAVAWAQVFALVMRPAKRDLRPVVITIGGFTGKLPPENAAIRAALDTALAATKKKYPIDVTALTIFPYKTWNRLGRPGCQDFSNRCVKQLLPRLRARDRRNQYGTYFERMMAYSGMRTKEPRTVNQLQHVIELLKKPRRPRESALQLSCFDPAKDHTGQPVRGFPCLQQIGIALGDDRKFSLNAFYPTQFIFDRAYGNYLGLCQLADFISHEANLSFSHLNCFVGRPELGLVRKADLGKLFAVASSEIAANPPARETP